MLVLAENQSLDRHETPPGHPERAARLAAALRGVDDAGLREAVVELEPRRATEEELAAVHSVRYLHAVEELCASGGGRLDADTTASAGSWDTALLAAGALLEALDALEAGRGDLALVAVRPPGHHARGEQAMGFCLINTVAVAAAALAARGERVLVVDWDVHHGNGTQDIFWDDPRVLYASTHQSPLYPGTGRVEETGGPNAKGLTLNVPVPPASAGDALRAAFDEIVAPAAEAFDATWLLVSAGFDAHRDDPLSDLRLSAGDFADLALRARAMVRAPGRMALVLEGGYDLDALRMSVGSTLASLLGTRYVPEPATGSEAGVAEVRAGGRLRERLLAEGIRPPVL